MYEVQDRQENSVMFPKEARPPYLQDDAYFNTFTPEVGGGPQGGDGVGPDHGCTKVEPAEREESGEGIGLKDEYSSKDGGHQSWQR